MSSIKNKKVAIIMALHNKNDALSNVLYSIKNQKTEHETYFYFLDDMSKNDPTPIIYEFFNKEKVFYEKKPINGFQFIARNLANMIPSDIDYVIYQSSDVIWLEENLLDYMISSIQNEPCIAVPKILNFEVDQLAWKKSENFKQEVLKNLNDYDKYGDIKDPFYIFLGAMTRENYLKISKADEKDSFACDVIIREKINKELKFRLLDSVAIHQRHENVVYSCSSANQCSIECMPKQWARRGVNFPFSLGTYNLRVGQFVK